MAETAKVHFSGRASQGDPVAEDHRVAPGLGPKTEMHPLSRIA